MEHSFVEPNFSPGPGVYSRGDGMSLALTVDNYGMLTDGNGIYYNYDYASGTVGMGWTDGGIQGVYPEQLLGFAGLARATVSAAYNGIARLTAMGPPTYQTFAAGSYARSTLKWMTLGPVYAGRAPHGPRFYWNRAGGDFHRAVQSLSHSNNSWDSLIRYAPLAIGGY